MKILECLINLILGIWAGGAIGIIVAVVLCSFLMLPKALKNIFDSIR